MSSSHAIEHDPTPDVDATPVVQLWLQLQRAIFDAHRLGQTLPCETDPESWFDDDPRTRRVAARACVPCPIRVDCMEFAVSSGEEFGVWGGRDFRATRPKQAQPTCAEGHPLEKTAHRRS